MIDSRCTRAHYLGRHTQTCRPIMRGIVLCHCPAPQNSADQLMRRNSWRATRRDVSSPKRWSSEGERGATIMIAGMGHRPTADSGLRTQQNRQSLVNADLDLACGNLFRSHEGSHSVAPRTPRKDPQLYLPPKSVKASKPFGIVYVFIGSVAPD